ncbi:hypothetical protein ACFY97_18390 [Streptomyces klenkii]|uniref:hypothetical protein n=1 Tax=Streptomyces klenkii TaxID=1420899 RepID=UPI0036E65C43
MSPSSPIPPGSITGTSPLVERINPATDRIEVRPAFGAQLHVVLHTTTDMPEPAVDSFAAVTVYGDGRIEYHVTATPAVDEPVAYELADESPQLTEVEVLRARLAAVENLIQRAVDEDVPVIDRVLVARAAGGER